MKYSVYHLNVQRSEKKIIWLVKIWHKLTLSNSQHFNCIKTNDIKSADTSIEKSLSLILWKIFSSYYILKILEFLDEL